MGRCPLPVDWLDLLEGEPSPASRAHLADCRSCRAVVHALERGVAETRLEGPLDQIQSRRARPAWEERRPHRASFGEIWWTAESFEAAGVEYRDLDRLPVLVVDVAEPSEEDWLEAVPLWTDWENATSSDVLLERDDTSADIPWRTVFRLQTVLHRAQLDRCIGSLTKKGEELLRDVLSGSFRDARFGTQLTDEFDPRLYADRWMEVITATLGRYHATAEEADAETTRDEEPGEVEVLIFSLKNVALENEAETYSLAAKAAASGQAAKHAVIEHGNRVLEGYLTHEISADRLSFEAIRASGFPAMVRLVVRSSRLPKPVASPPFVATEGAVVAFADGLGISHFDVEEMELEAKA
jgi:hypothetical protein